MGMGMGMEMEMGMVVGESDVEDGNDINSCA